MLFYIQLAVCFVLGAFILLFVSTAWLERQRIHEFVPAPTEEAAGGSPYFVAMNEAAERLGFNFAGVFVQARGSRVYQARLALWISADGQTLLRIGGGKTAGMQIRRTTLTSLVEPCRIVETTDECGMADLTGLTDRQLVLNAHLDELLARHQARLAQCPDLKRAFAVSEALTSFETMQAMKAAQMERLGLGRFLNRERTVWRHTLKGAIMCCSKGLHSPMAEGRLQSERITLKRPGDK
jgi:hypothetical protein